MSLLNTTRTPIPTKRVVVSAKDIEPPPDLDIPLVTQNEDAWCYAACAQMVINFCIRPGTADQCNVASFIKGADCCNTNDTQCIESGCDKDQIQNIFEHWDIDFRGSNQNPLGMISLDEITDDIHTAGNPIEIVVDWINFEGSHALVLSGARDDFVYLLDPLVTHGGWKPYEFLFSGDDGDDAWVWDRTWAGLKRRVRLHGSARHD